jgi:hypothetical protein
MKDAYYYRPIAYFGGKVLKCAGMVSEENIKWFPSERCAEPKDGYLPGFVIAAEYKGDRVIAGSMVEYKDGDPLTGEMVCEVEVRNVYGNEMIYPANYAAERFAAIAGKKTLSRTDLMNIKALGFAVEEVAIKKLA